MITVAFWNVHQNTRIDEALMDLIRLCHVSLLVLAEYEGNPRNVCNMLAQEGRDFGVGPHFDEGRIQVLYEKTVCRSMEIRRETEYYLIYRMRFAADMMTLMGVHFPSKMYASADKQALLMRRCRADLEKEEAELKDQKTVIVGDFNADPFEAPVLAADTFHGLPDRAIAMRGKRTVLGESYSSFYNPMWNLFGDFEKPPGTYFYNASEYADSQWHIFDQVILRGEMQPKLVDASLRILTEIGTRRLMNHLERPDAQSYSDHLPIVFSLEV